MSTSHTPEELGSSRLHGTEGEPVDLEAARALLDRAVRFLSRCKDDPAGAVDDDDPSDLIEKLRSLDLRYLSGGSEETLSVEQPSAIHRRRSA